MKDLSEDEPVLDVQQMEGSSDLINQCWTAHGGSGGHFFLDSALVTWSWQVPADHDAGSVSNMVLAGVSSIMALGTFKKHLDQCFRKGVRDTAPSLLQSD